MLSLQPRAPSFLPHNPRQLHIQHGACHAAMLATWQAELSGIPCVAAVLVLPRFLEPVSPDEDGGVPLDDQLLTSLEVELLQDVRHKVAQLAATAWAQTNLPVPQVS